MSSIHSGKYDTLARTGDIAAKKASVPEIAELQGATPGKINVNK